MKLNKAWAKQISFTLIEHGGVRILDALTTFVLIRVLAAQHFGLFSVYQSWVAMALLFFPSIELALFRQYAALKRSGTLARELSVYRLFNYVKLAVLVALIVALSFISQRESQAVRLSLLAFAFALPFSQAFYSFMREPLRFEMRQRTVALIGVFQRLLLLGAVIGVAVSATKETSGYVPIMVSAALFVYFVSGLAWSHASKAFFKDAPFVPDHAFEKVKKTFLGIVIWIHLNGVITQTIQLFDVFALNLFKTDLAEIGRYSIALKAANFFQILPVALASSFGVYLAKHQGEVSEKAERRFVLKSTTVFAVLGLALFIFGLYVGEPLLSFLAKGKISVNELAATYEIFKWQLAGVLVLCASHPLSTYLSARSPLPRLLIFINLPWLLFAVGGYLWSASQGSLVSAKMNVLVYAFAVALLFHVFFKKARS